ncbi:MAG: hypothetical protein KGL39_17315 [Patescibacteria group bacterium]|nr:hypothetical protein [Patescibacteria group bacterium]
MGEPKSNDVISIPAFLSARSRSIDQVYRDTERSSQVRAEKAAEMAGVPVSDMSDLKITDLRTNTYEGDMAIKPVVNAVTQQMDMINARGGAVGWQGSNGVEYSQAVQTGPHPNMGAKMRSAIQRANGMVSDRPALETQQPGYRIRG